MTTKRIFAAIISIMILCSCFAVSASTFPPQDSAVWTNLSDKQADNLLKSKSESFIFFFYRDICPNSQRSISAILKYAQQNNMSLCGLNTTDYPAWMTWANYLEPGQTSIGFPYIIVYNAKDDILVAQDNVLTVKGFEDLLKKANWIPEGNNPAGNTGTANKGFFKDVAEGSPYYEAVKQLVSDGVLSGYEDGTFKPNNSITRTEAAVVIVRAGKLSTNSSKKSTYTDVANNFWGKDYIMAASDAGIIKGMGNGKFAPQDKLTRNQIIKMIVCMVGKEQEALGNGGWPKGYVKVAGSNSIIDVETYTQMVSGNYGDLPASRGEVAQWIYNSRNINGGVDGDFKVAGKVYKLGMASAELGSPDEVWPSTHGFSWHIFGTSDYKNFFAAGVVEGKVVALVSTGVGFEYKGYQAGDTLAGSTSNSGEFLLDKNDGNIIHGILILDSAYKTQSIYNSAALLGESKMNFHCTNGFRVYHKMDAYKWDDNAADAARLHSEDMANNGYFAHEGLNGSDMGDRMRAQGVNWTMCAENIHAGSSLGVNAYNNWVNSSGHRKNMLGTCTHLGVGFAYNANSQYRFYSTQNFYAHQNAFDTFFN